MISPLRFGYLPQLPTAGISFPQIALPVAVLSAALSQKLDADSEKWLKLEEALVKTDGDAIKAAIQLFGEGSVRNTAMFLVNQIYQPLTLDQLLEHEGYQRLSPSQQTGLGTIFMGLSDLKIPDVNALSPKPQESILAGIFDGTAVKDPIAFRRAISLVRRCHLQVQIERMDEMMKQGKPIGFSKDSLLELGYRNYLLPAQLTQMNEDVNQQLWDLGIPFGVLFKYKTFTEFETELFTQTTRKKVAPWQGFTSVKDIPVPKKPVLVVEGSAPYQGVFGITPNDGDFGIVFIYSDFIKDVANAMLTPVSDVAFPKDKIPKDPRLANLRNLLHEQIKKECESRARIVGKTPLIVLTDTLKLQTQTHEVTHRGFSEFRSVFFAVVGLVSAGPRNLNTNVDAEECLAELATLKVIIDHKDHLGASALLIQGVHNWKPPHQDGMLVEHYEEFVTAILLRSTKINNGRVEFDFNLMQQLFNSAESTIASYFDSVDFSFFRPKLAKYLAEKGKITAGKTDEETVGEMLKYIRPEIEKLQKKHPGLTTKQAFTQYFGDLVAEMIQNKDPFLPQLVSATARMNKGLQKGIAEKLGFKGNTRAEFDQFVLENLNP